MRKIIDILFRKRNNESFEKAKEKLDFIKGILEDSKPKLIRFQEIYITEIHY